MIKNAYDVTIIGAGPVGMYSAFYAALRKMKVKIIDSLPQLGGQLQAIYPEKYIYDLPGYPQVLAGDFIENLKKQMDTVGSDIDVVLNERVEYVRRRGDDNIIEICTEQTCHYTKTVLITAGKGAFQPRTLQLENEDFYRNIHYLVNDMNYFKDKKVVIFGGGDSAVDWANMLNGFSKEVTIVHRRDVFRAHEHSVEQMMNSDVSVLTSYAVDEVIGKENKISEIKLKSTKEEDPITVSTDEVIVLYGFLSSLGPIETWDLELENKALLVNQNKQTSIHGIYAAGDACIYPGKVKMITCGFGEGIIAVNSIYGYLNPNQSNAPVHSSALKGK